MRSSTSFLYSFALLCLNQKGAAQELHHRQVLNSTSSTSLIGNAFLNAALSSSSSSSASPSSSSGSISSHDASSNSASGSSSSGSASTRRTSTASSAPATITLDLSPSEVSVLASQLATGGSSAEATLIIIPATGSANGTFTPEPSVIIPTASSSVSVPPIVSVLSSIFAHNHTSTTRRPRPTSSTFSHSTRSTRSTSRSSTRSFLSTSTRTITSYTSTSTVLTTASSSSRPSSSSSSTSAAVIPTTSPTPPPSTSASSNLSGGSIAGITIGAVSAAALAFTALMYLLRRRAAGGRREQVFPEEAYLYDPEMTPPGGGSSLRSPDMSALGGSAGSPVTPVRMDSPAGAAGAGMGAHEGDTLLARPPSALGGAAMAGAAAGAAAAAARRGDSPRGSSRGGLRAMTSSPGPSYDDGDPGPSKRRPSAREVDVAEARGESWPLSPEEQERTTTPEIQAVRRAWGWDREVGRG
ncbi:hypothetical protein K402DRAFT_236057 [Aulographum hederae CBS 113979]|uniref:Mid2 domain-containing protein n=1 Tax=Aulographum hederae CBS 113979 TaxID=1176131 RepID=A0A6G1GL23_9PEZI|nr:hypothetical protein K402DRAFT_236057 [Aulographum hederae CBS 113979]